MERPPPPAVLVEVTRGPLVESRHLGHVAVVTGDGRLVFEAGDADHVAFFRSSAKPLHAVALAERGGVERFALTEGELALACGSHNSEDAHVETVRAMLAKMGLEEGALQCGLSEPMDPAVADALEARGEEPGLAHNECSGDHAGLLALALLLRAPTATYLERGHPVHAAVRATLARFTDLDADAMPEATDGCRIPTQALPLRAMALAYARLAAPPESWSSGLRAACARVAGAMTTHPEMVEGTRDEITLDTPLMRAGAGGIVSKLGAEGLYTAGVRASARFPHGVGIAVKIEDGDLETRARPPVAVRLLRSLGALTEADVEQLGEHQAKPVTDNAGEAVGEVRAVALAVPGAPSVEAGG